MSITNLRSAVALSLALCLSDARSQVARTFAHPQPVIIQGYEGDAMEPFLSRDAHYLFFNNSNEPNVNTNLYWAERIDDLHFKFRGELKGINTNALEAVASMDIHGNFYFVSNRSYDRTFSTLYRGKFTDGVISSIELVPGVSLAKPGIVNFDAEISADGKTLYYVESQFSWRGQPKSAKILFAHQSGSTFVRDPNSEILLKFINTDTLNYAPALSSSELEIFFTRVGQDGLAIYQATRAATSQPFGNPTRIESITGFAEDPTISPDGNSL